MAYSGNQNHPPGRVKIVTALRSLLEQKSFNAIRTAEIASHAGVTESLIYKYFRDVRCDKLQHNFFLNA